MPRPPKVDRLLRDFFAAEGRTSPGLRAAAASAAGSPGLHPSPEALPPELVPFIHKVSQHAYKVTDEDIAALRAAGYDEDTLYELTLATATGAALFRLDAGLRALALAGPPAKD